MFSSVFKCRKHLMFLLIFLEKTNHFKTQWSLEFHWVVYLLLNMHDDILSWAIQQRWPLAENIEYFTLFVMNPHKFHFLKWQQNIKLLIIFFIFFMWRLVLMYLRQSFPCLTLWQSPPDSTSWMNTAGPSGLLEPPPIVIPKLLDRATEMSWITPSPGWLRT